MRSITEDTKRALAAIEPLARVLGISVSADGSCLYLNGQAIGISANSTWATVMEFVGYAFAEKWCPYGCSIRMKLPKALDECIKRYWISEERLANMRQLEEMEGL